MHPTAPPCWEKLQSVYWLRLRQLNVSLFRRDILLVEEMTAELQGESVWNFINFILRLISLRYQDASLTSSKIPFANRILTAPLRYTSSWPITPSTRGWLWIFNSAVGSEWPFACLLDPVTPNETFLVLPEGAAIGEAAIVSIAGVGIVGTEGSINLGNGSGNWKKYSPLVVILWFYTRKSVTKALKMEYPFTSSVVSVLRAKSSMMSSNSSPSLSFMSVASTTCVSASQALPKSTFKKVLSANHQSREQTIAN